jgi:hypothetical protein
MCISIPPEERFAIVNLSLSSAIRASPTPWPLLGFGGLLLTAFPLFADRSYELEVRRGQANAVSLRLVRQPTAEPSAPS